MKVRMLAEEDATGKSLRSSWRGWRSDRDTLWNSQKDHADA